ncbi:hypothetical protein LCGC14_1957200 [marine sediment metagenome]|uniref:Holin n=1 Tax=marine sediment metagenome TaxID=412755 RepID=A0A0F9G3X8_9ZZZZ
MIEKITSAPSTTVTWATLAGFGAAGIWEAVATFTEWEPTAGLIAGSTALAAGVVGKLVTEKRYKMTVRT